MLHRFQSLVLQPPAEQTDCDLYRCCRQLPDWETLWLWFLGSREGYDHVSDDGQGTEGRARRVQVKLSPKVKAMKFYCNNTGACERGKQVRIRGTTRHI